MRLEKGERKMGITHHSTKTTKAPTAAVIFINREINFSTKNKYIYQGKDQFTIFRDPNYNLLPFLVFVYSLLHLPPSLHWPLTAVTVVVAAGYQLRRDAALGDQLCFSPLYCSPFSQIYEQIFVTLR